MKKIEIFKIEGGRINRQRRHCPKCGDGVFLAQHKDRSSCGCCGYTEFKGGDKKQPNFEKKPAESKPENLVKEEKPKDEIKEKSPTEGSSEEKTQ